MKRYEINIEVRELDDDGESSRDCYRLSLQGWSPVEVMTIGADQIQNALNRWADMDLGTGTLADLGFLGVKLSNVNFIE